MRETEWRYPGREHILFTNEELIHHGSMIAYKLPELPLAARAGFGDDTFVPRMVTILPTELITEDQNTSPWGA